jgi:hypothetical protein
MVNWIAISQKNGLIYYFRDEQYGDEAIPGVVWECVADVNWISLMFYFIGE